MHFVPIPAHVEALRKTEPHWAPFLKRLADEFDTTFAYLLHQIYSDQIQIGLVWDGKKAHAIAGWALLQGAQDLVAEILWVEGKGRENWQHLLSELEKYLIEHLRVNVIRPKPRPGWAPMLKKRGYKTTHFIMEKRV
jgi:hypothetical protein